MFKANKNFIDKFGNRINFLINNNMISAKIVADSKAPNGERLTTLEVVFPRYILAELNTHRLFSKNSASSRAIPFNKMVKEVQENPFIPYAWQKEHSGMQGTDYFTEPDDIEFLTDMWQAGIDSAIERAKALNNPEAFIDKRGLTKQMTNRLLEPFMWHKVLISGTEWENFFNLRCPRYNINGTIFKSRKDAIAKYPMDANLTTLEWLQCNEGQADIHMMFLAEAIYDVINESTPKELKEGEWHIPYGDNMDIDVLNELIWQNVNHNKVTYKECIDSIPFHPEWRMELKCKISIARCARLSYQTLGDNPEINYQKDLELYEVLSKSGHWSPFEHVAKAMSSEEHLSWIKGKSEGEISDPDSYFTDESVGWCRNFRGFIQYRVLLD